MKKVLEGGTAHLRSVFQWLFGSSKAPSRQVAAHEPLEPRLLYSADLAPLALVAQDASPAASVSAQALDQGAPTQANKPSIELVVVDSRVGDVAALLNDVANQQANGRPLVLIEVQADENGLAIISAALEQARQNGQEVSAVHLVSHGRDGEFDIGNQTINQASLRSNSATFAQWANAFSADGDLLIYGCNFAQSAKGQGLAKSLSELTGADVAANPQATGAQALGGDWVLDFATGSIEARGVTSQAFQSNWQHLLTPVFTDATPQKVNTGTGAAITGYSTNTSLSSGGRIIGIAANGDYVVVWENSSQDVKFRRFNADGTAKDATERALSTSGSLLQKQPSIAVASSGEFVIAWTDTQFSGVAIRAERYDANGTIVGGTSIPGSAPTRPSVAFDESNKDFVIVWEEGIANRGIYAQAFTWSGNKLSTSPFRVNQFGGENSYRPSVAVLSGRAMVVWEGQDADGGGIKYRDFNLDGSNVRAEIIVNSSETSEQNAPDIAVAQSGNFVVAWQISVSGNDATRFRIFDQDLNAMTSDVRVTIDHLGNQNIPKVAVADDGRFVIVQQDVGIAQDANGKAVTVTVFNADGTRNETYPEGSLSYVLPNDTYVTGDQIAPAVSWRGGQVATAWTSNATGTNVVLSRRLDLNAVAGLNVVLPTSNQLVEGDAAKQISVRLNTAPTSNVTVTASVSNAQGTLTNATLIFTPTNWSIAQSIGVAATADLTVDANTPFTVALKATSTDATYNVLVPQSYPFTSINVDQLHDIVVDTNVDTIDGSDVSSLTALYLNRGTDGKISLREALTAANNTSNSLGADRITFDISVSLGLNPVILLTAALPTITDAVMIDGTNQPNSTAATDFITLVGSSDGTTAQLPLTVFSGLTLGVGSSDSDIRGLAITGFNDNGITVQSSNNTFKQNYLGFSPLNSALPKNQLNGIYFYAATSTNATNNLVQDNVISNNNAAGVQVNGADSNRIINNNIGTNAAGNAALANGGDGVLINTKITGTVNDGAVGNSIRGNVIAGNTGSGIRIIGYNTGSNIVTGNYIGTNASGLSIGNIIDGVSIQQASSLNVIGGVTTGDGNRIAYNGNHGVLVMAPDASLPVGSQTSNNSVLQNSLFANGGLGIELVPFDRANNSFQFGPTANDAGDVDVGPNGLMNFPEIAVASNDGTTSRIVGRINAVANSFYRVEFFSSQAADSSGYGEGAVFLGSKNVATNNSGIGLFTFDASVANAPIGNWISATATQTDSTFLIAGFLQTSEFSQAKQIVAAPVFTSSNKNITVDENTLPLLNVTLDLQNPSQTGLSFTIENVSTMDGQFGSINATSGALTFIAPANYEALLLDTPSDNYWWFKVRVTDGAFETSIIYKFKVTDVNEAPVIAVPTNVSGVEDTAIALTMTNSISIADVDTKTTINIAPIRVTVYAENAFGVAVGNLSTSGPLTGVALTIVAGGLQFDGQLSDVNAALQAVVLTPSLNDTQDVYMRVVAEDFGSGISGAQSLLSAKQFKIAFAAVNDPPVVSGLVPSIVFTENQSPLFIASSLVISDVDNTILSAASVQVTSGYHPALDIFTVQNTFGLTALFDTATQALSIAGAASVATYQDALRSVTYANSADVPHTEPRAVEFKVFDGVTWSTPQSVIIDVQAINDPPTATLPASLTVPYAETISLNSQGVFSIADVDAENSELEVTISATGGTLSLLNATGLTIVNGDILSATQLTYRGALADLNTAFGNLSYTATFGYVGAAQLTMQVDDLGNGGSQTPESSSRYTLPITVQPGIKPVLIYVGSSISFSEGAPPISLMPLVRLGGSNTNQITQAQVKILGGFESGFDTLKWAPPSASLAVAWSSVSGMLTITGSGTFLEYENLLRSITFENSSQNPSTLSRAIEIQAFDGVQASDVKTIAVAVTAVNDAPVLVSNQTLVTNEDVALSFSGANAWSVSDVDNTALRLGIEVSNGTLAWKAGTSVPSGVQRAGTRSVLLTGTAAQINSWASSIAFVPTTDFFGTANIRWSLADTAAVPAVVNRTSTIAVNAVNDTPTYNSGTDLKLDQAGTVQISATQAQALDVDNTAAQLTYRLSALPSSGVLILSGQTLSTNGQFTQADIDSGKLQYRHDGSARSSDSFSFVVTDTAGASTTNKTINVNIALRPVVIVQNRSVQSTAGNTQPTSASNSVSAASASSVAVDTKSTPANVSNADSSAGVAAANSSPQVNAQRAATRAISAPSVSTSPLNDSSVGVLSSTNPSSFRMGEPQKLGDEKVKLDSKHSYASVHNDGPKLDNLASLGFSRTRTAVESAEYAQIVRTALSDRGFIDDVKKIGDDVKQTLTIDRNVVASTTAVSAGLSIGYVIWLVRGGALLSSLLASVPAWRVMDPLPILGSMGEDGEQSDDESLEAMIDKANRKKLGSVQHSHSTELALDSVK